MGFSMNHTRGIAVREVVVIAVILSLALIVVLPYVYTQVGETRRVRCQQRQMGLAAALREYNATRGELPGYRNLLAVDASGRRQPTGWVFPLLPSLAKVNVLETFSPKSAETEHAEKSARYLKIHETHGPQGPDATRGSPPQVYLADLVCPDNRPEDVSETSTAMSYVVNCGMPDADFAGGGPADLAANGVFFDRFVDPATAVVMTLEDVEAGDGLAETLLLSENVDAGNWTDSSEPQVGWVWMPGAGEDAAPPEEDLLSINHGTGAGDGSYRFARPSSHHPGGVNAAYCDGRVEFLAETIDYLVYRRLMTSSSTSGK